MANEMGMGFMPWSPLANGVLSGKYSHADLGASQGGIEGSRKAIAGAHGSLSERSLAIAKVVGEIADEAGLSSAQVALAWVMANPGVTALLLGARTLQQLENNLGALNVTLSAEQSARLEAASAIELGFPHDLLRGDFLRAAISGGAHLPQRSW